MNLLLIAPDIQQLSSVCNFSGVWSWYLSQEFKRRGINVRFDPPQHDGKSPVEIIRHYSNLDFTGIDHILALGTRYFERIPREAGLILMDSFKGAVTQVHDSGRIERTCDCTFTLRSDRSDDRNHYVGWAADHEIIRPEHVEGELRILVDHPDYGAGVRPDHSERIAAECLAFARSGIWKDQYSSIKLRRLVDNAIEDLTDELKPYHRQPVSFEEVCAEYSKTHLFMVTHPESVGLTVLETAMAGALPVVPKRFIQKDRLATVRNVEYSGHIPWADVLESIDIQASRETAMANSWGMVAARMLTYFKNFRRA